MLTRLAALPCPQRCHGCAGAEPLLLPPHDHGEAAGRALLLLLLCIRPHDELSCTCCFKSWQCCVCWCNPARLAGKRPARPLSLSHHPSLHHPSLQTHVDLIEKLLNYNTLERNPVQQREQREQPSQQQQQGDQ